MTEIRLRIAFLFVAVVLIVSTSACVFGGSGVDSAAFVNRLPTLTRTPLPTLTPTSVANVNLVESDIADISVQQIADAEVSGVNQHQLVSEAESNSQTSSPATLVGSAPEEHSQNPNPADQPVAVAQAPVDTPTPTLSPPTETPTPLPTETPTPLPTETPAPLPTATETPLPQGWVFYGVQSYADQYSDGLLLYGDVFNNTGVAQELLAIEGDFFDGQGVIIANSDSSYAYWPGYVVPAGGSMPFEMVVEGIQSVADFSLRVESEPSDDIPRQDFEFSGVNQLFEDNLYCLQGALRNPGDKFNDYLLIAATLYDGQDNVISFSDYQEFGLAEVRGDQTSTFEICADLVNQDVTRYELQAWGR